MNKINKHASKSSVLLFFEKIFENSLKKTFYLCYNVFMKNFEYRNKRKDNLIEKIVSLVRKNPQVFVKIIACILILIGIIISIVVLVKESKKQKYVEYDGTNINEARYPGYKELIDELQGKHPNWTFTLFYTKLDWNVVIANEGHSDDRTYPLNLIPDSSDYPEDWKCEIDKDKRFDNGTWLCASDKAIKCQMDPRNILNEDNIFQFKELSYVEGAQTKEGLNKITEGSFLEGDNISNALIEAGKKANLGPIFYCIKINTRTRKKRNYYVKRISI